MNFHLRHTFQWVVGALGLQYLGVVDGATHAQVFRRKGSVRLRMARRRELVSRVVGPMLNSSGSAVARIKRLIIL